MNVNNENNLHHQNNMMNQQQQQHIHPYGMVVNNHVVPSSASSINNNNTNQTIYPWSGISHIPINFIPQQQQQFNVVEGLHPNVQIEMQEQPQEALIPNNEQQTSSATPQGACSRFGKCCGHAKQKKFLHALTTKAWSRIPRGVSVAFTLLLILTVTFLLTIGKSVDNNVLSYRRSQCKINTDTSNLLVHFDYDRDLYYVNLNVTVGAQGCHTRGQQQNPEQRKPQEPKQEPKQIEGKAPEQQPTDVQHRPQSQRDRSVILSEVCASSLKSKTSDCRDALLAQGSLTCFANSRMERHSEMMQQVGGDRHDYGGRKEAPSKPASDTAPKAQDDIAKTKPSQPNQPNQPTQPNQPNKMSSPRHESSFFGMVKTHEQVKKVFHRSLKCTGTLFVILSTLLIAAFIFIGYKKFEGKTKCSFDRFYRQYFVNPFESSGEVYKLDEVSSSAIVIQDPSEPKQQSLLSSSTLQMENTPRQERVLAKRMSKFLTLLRHTATKSQETLLFYEKVSRKNLCQNKSCKGRSFLMIFKKVMKVFAFVLLFGLIGFTLFSTVTHFATGRVFGGLLRLIVSLALFSIVILAVMCRRMRVHYYITDSRVIRVIELPLRLRLTLRSVTFENIKSVWAEENKIHLKIADAKGVEQSGVMFEHVVDPNFVVSMIQQRLVDNTVTTTTTSEESN